MLIRAYDTGARTGRIANSLSHLMLALSASLPEGNAEEQDNVAGDNISMCDAALEAFGHMSRELGRMMSYIVQARRQVWLSQSPLTEASRRTLRGLPVEPGAIFGSAAQEALDRTIQAGQTRRQLASLRLMPPPNRPPPAGAGSPRLLHELACHHQLALGASAAISALHGGRPATLGSLTPRLLGPLGNFEPRTLDAPPPGPLGVEGPDTEATGPAVGYFSHQQLRYWAARASDPWVLSTLTHGYNLQFRRRPPTSGRVKMTTIGDPAKAIILGQELSALLAKGAIEPVDPLLQARGFYSKYFLVPKKTGGFRPVLDLRGLNRFLKIMPFHMLTTADVLQSVTHGEWFTSVDLQDAYFHVPIAPQHRQFLRFAYQGRRWQFRVLPFGLSLSPRVFTRCMAAALAPLQAQGIKILPYLDDWLICAPSREEAAAQTERLLSHVSRLGLKVNIKKSCLNPSQDTTFIGLALHTRSMSARPSPRRVDDILKLLPIFRRGRHLSYLSFLRLLGTLTSVAAVVPLGLLLLRPLQRWLNGHHLDAERHRHRRITVSKECLLALVPWRDRAYISRGVPMGQVPSRREIVTTDACPLGWGAVWQSRTARGQWSAADRTDHINVLELRAVHLALQHFLPFLRGRHVLIRSDNTSTVCHINHQGGTKSARLLQVSTDLLRWAAPRLAGLRATHLPGERNQVADFLSRQKPPSGEWCLHPEVVQSIWERFGRAEVDLFASEASTHCHLWFSLAEATSPLGQDALAHPWPEALLYAFPPLPLIRPVLQRVLQEGHTVLLVAPFWPGRTWFPLLYRLCRGTPWRLPDRRDLLSQLGGRIWYPDPQRFKLCVWLLEGPSRC